MENKEVTIQLNGKSITISLVLKNKCDAAGLEFTESLNDKILSLHSPASDITDSDYRFNIRNALYNKLYHDKYGDFIQYFSDGTIKQSSSLFDLLKNSFNEDSLFSFSFYHQNGIVPKIDTINFFGSELQKMVYEGMESDRRIFFLNRLIKEVIKNTKKCNQEGTDLFFKDLEWRAFSICRWLRDSLLGFNELSSRKETVPQRQYDETIKKVLDRYSYQGKTLFKEVDRIASYRKDFGIYIFCLDGLREIYVGQTKSSLGKRILQHISRPNTDFDRSISYIDIKKITR